MSESINSYLLQKIRVIRVPVCSTVFKEQPNRPKVPFGPGGIPAHTTLADRVNVKDAAPRVATKAICAAHDRAAVKQIKPLRNQRLGADDIWVKSDT
ncbi:hypothetical protein ACP2AV_02005 [Aliiroseovarius sp. PTFE2010]|uniref:hypothetical protein n=1 Tax=Aliiroseovarius sp. PTFE2010 TaxID=3417190 RepID=UPI003CF4695D